MLHFDDDRSPSPDSIPSSPPVTYRTPCPSPLFSGRPTTNTLFSSNTSAPDGLRIIYAKGGIRIIRYSDEPAFMRWWEATTNGAILSSQPKPFTWTFNRSSKVWDFFKDVATFPLGKPKVQCTTCYQVLAHPSIKNTGTSALINHRKRGKCAGISRKSSAASTNIQKTSCQDTDESYADKICDDIIMLFAACSFGIGDNVHFRRRLPKHTPQFPDLVPLIQMIKDRVSELRQLHHSEELSKILAGDISDDDFLEFEGISDVEDPDEILEDRARFRDGYSENIDKRAF